MNDMLCICLVVVAVMIVGACSPAIEGNDGNLYRITVYTKDDMEIHKTYDNVKSWDFKWGNDLEMTHGDGTTSSVKGFYMVVDAVPMRSDDETPSDRWDKH